MTRIYRVTITRLPFKFSRKLAGEGRNQVDRPHKCDAPRMCCTSKMKAAFILFVALVPLVDATADSFSEAGPTLSRRRLNWNETFVDVDEADVEATESADVRYMYSVSLLSNANVPEGSLDDVEAHVDEILKPLFDFSLCFESLSPGEVVSTRERLLRGGQNERKLPLIRCPSSCKNSGSTSCRSLGCAYCTKCRRRRSRSLSAVTRLSIQDRKAIEADIDALLQPYCLMDATCLLKSRVKQHLVS
jgi:hypothetical protein